MTDKDFPLIHYNFGNGLPFFELKRTSALVKNLRHGFIVEGVKRQMRFLPLIFGVSILHFSIRERTVLTEESVSTLELL